MLDVVQNSCKGRMTMVLFKVTRDRIQHHDATHLAMGSFRAKKRCENCEARCRKVFLGPLLGSSSEVQFLLQFSLALATNRVARKTTTTTTTNETFPRQTTTTNETLQQSTTHTLLTLSHSTHTLHLYTHPHRVNE